MNMKPKTALSAAVFLFMACLVAQPSFADDSSRVLGIWKLVSYEVEVQATGQKAPVMGEKPTGYATFTQEGRVFFVLTGEAAVSSGAIGQGLVAHARRLYRYLSH